MKDSKPVVVGIGELLWDVLPTGKRAGGAPINFVYHATQLGAEGYAVSAVGNDVFGTEIVQELDKNGICHLLGTVEYPTGSVMVELKDGIPTYTIIEGVAWDHIPLTQEAVDLVKEADAICFGTLAQRSPESRATIHALLSYARKEALRFFDVNIRQSYYSKELIASLLEEANVFKINDEELDLIREMFSLSEDEDTACRQLVERYSLRYMILTAGSQNHIAQAVTLNQLAASCIFILRKGEHFTYQVEFLVIDLKYIRLFQQTGDQLLRVVRLADIDIEKPKRLFTGIGK